MWNGTALILKARPASTNTRPNSRPSDGAPRAKVAASPLKLVGAGKAVEQRDAVEQDPARERAEHEIFEAGLGRALVGAAIGGKHIAARLCSSSPT